MNIGVTMYETSFPTQSPKIRLVHQDEYSLTDALITHHATPLLLPTVAPSSDIINHFISKIDGLILGGGDDITPTMYHAISIEPELNYPLRDYFEAAMIKAAIRKRLPILGICRGCQMINVALGGTLYQNIYRQIKGQSLLDHEYGEHPVAIKQSSALYRTLGSRQIVNSRHHQAIRKIGSHLRVVARAPDHIIEGIENRDALVQGVQWHPEDLWRSNPNQDQLFQDFLKRVKKTKQKDS